MHKLLGRTIASVGVASCLAATVLSLSAVALAAQGPLTIQGSDTMLILDRRLTQVYSAHNSQVHFDVIGGGSEVGIAALLSGKIDLAAASRPMKETELQAFEKRVSSRPKELTVALDGVAIYVHDYNPISRLTVAQIAQLMTGEIRNWSEVGGANLPVQVYTRDKGSGTRTFMQEHLLKGKPFVASAREAATTEQLATLVSIDPGGIGYGGVAYARGSHILRVAADANDVGLWPREDAVATGKYLLSRPLYYYVNPKSKRSDIAGFTGWVLSPEGQEIVSEMGYFRIDRNSAEPVAVVPAAAKSTTSREVLVRPDNAQELGFRVAFKTESRTTTDHVEQTSVTVRFDPAGSAILAIRELQLTIGQDALVPLVLDRDLSARFTLRKGLIENTTLELREGGAPLAGAVYQLRLADFLVSK